MRHRYAVLAASLAALGAGAPSAQAQQALQLAADANETGWIAFHVHGRPGTTVAIAEQVGSTTVPVADVPLSGEDAYLPRALRWRCDRRTRRFVASAPGPFGATEASSAELATRSCRRRLRADVGRRTRAGRRVGVWRPGRWRVEAKVRGGRRLRRSVRVRPRAGRLRLLATGDSMIQIVDSFLKQRLHGRVRSDAHISTGISKPGKFAWVRHARRQAASRPDVTVMFIGANEGFPIGGAACCGPGWVRRYAERVRRMMTAYKRGRAGVVYWLMLPTPRGDSFARVFGAVNRALRRAAAPFRAQVRLIDLRRTFTPDRRFHRMIRYRGRRVVARQDDGVHLSTAGASIAADLIIRALTRDRIL